MSFKLTVLLLFAIAIKKLRHDVDMGAAENGIKEWLKSRIFTKNNVVC